MVQPGELHFSAWEQVLLSAPAVQRLLMACGLGGLIGLQRELRHKESGLRTNMLICMGAALFTLIGAALAGAATPDKSRVASNIVQGVGFLGAGLILHNRNRVHGLTTAASVFVVAAIGMACGAGLYVLALLATVIVFIALQGIGILEGKVGWQRFTMVYEVRADVGTSPPAAKVGEDTASSLAAASDAARHRMMAAILSVLDAEGQRLVIDQHDNVGGLERIVFEVLATPRAHGRIFDALRASDATDQVVRFRDPEDE